MNEPIIVYHLFSLSLPLDLFDPYPTSLYPCHVLKFSVDLTFNLFLTSYALPQTAHNSVNELKGRLLILFLLFISW